MKFLALLFILLIGNPDTEEGSVNSVQISGLVVEEFTGEPIPGALVKIKSENKEIYTDFEGNFYFDDIKPGKYTIEVSFISHSTKELTDQDFFAGTNTLLISLN